MKTPLGAERDLGPGHIVLDGYPALLQKEHSNPPPFRPMSIAPISATAEFLFIVTCANIVRFYQFLGESLHGDLISKMCLL